MDSDMESGELEQDCADGETVSTPSCPANEAEVARAKLKAKLLSITDTSKDNPSDTRRYDTSKDFFDIYGDGVRHQGSFFYLTNKLAQGRSNNVRRDFFFVR